MVSMCVEELKVPASLNDPAAADFVKAAELVTTVDLTTLGIGDFTHTPGEWMPMWQTREHEPRVALAVRDGGRIVACALGEWRNTVAAAAYWWQDILHVHPDHQGRGIGRALADYSEELARSRGKKWFVARVASPYRPGEQVEPASRFGSIGRDNREVGFLLARGYRLEQVIRRSRFPLPADPSLLAELRAAADEKAGSNYRIDYWMDRTPPHWEEQMLIQRQRLWKDIPVAGVPYPGQSDPDIPWTMERIRQEEDDFAAAGCHQLFAAAIHIPTGTIAGYTQLIIPENPARPVTQEATHVLAEHRGRRLSMLLKIANIQEVQKRFQGRAAIVTTNSEENRHMLVVNEALHFTPTFTTGTWVKQL